MKQYRDTNYYALEDGRIYNKKLDRFVNGYVTNYGYLAICYRHKGKQINRHIHRIVAECFFGESSLTVNHKDGNKFNNSVSNLEYVTRSENSKHGHENGLIDNRGEKCGVSKLNDVLVKEIKGKILLGMSDSCISKEYGVSYFCIRDIRVGRTWKHIE